MLVPDFLEDSILCLQVHFSKGIILVTKLLPYGFIWVHDFVRDLNCSCFDSEEFVEQSFVILADTEGRDQVAVSVEHDESVNFTLLVGATLWLVDVESVFLDTRDNVLGRLTQTELVLDLSEDAFKSVDGILDIYLVSVVVLKQMACKVIIEF